MSNEIVQREKIRQANDIEQNHVKPEAGIASQDDTDKEAMEIFREVSKSHHSLWVSLAKG